jgi:GlpG protein
VVVFLLHNLSNTSKLVTNALAFSAAHLQQINGQLRIARGGFEDIYRGEVWRLVTPALMHFGPIHLLFDLWALSLFGSLIEYRRGTWTLAVLVLASAVTSNVGEALYELNTYGHTVTFGGMSGVVYALFGYVWMKGRYEPEQGMILHPNNVQTMLLWLVLCMTGFVGNIANGAHVVGLAAGILCGLARL